MKNKSNTVFKLLMSAAVVAGAFVSPAGNVARADIFVWEDPQSHMTISYPDRWSVANNERPDDVLTIAGPGQNDHAQCRLRVRDDKRFAIYPQRFSDNIQHIAYADNFWDSYLAEYDNVNVRNFYNDGGLGRGFGSMALAGYTTALGPKMDKTAIMAVSLYNNKAYIVECSAEKHAYDKWHDSFLSVIKSVDFRKEIYELPTGNYRNFLKGEVKINGTRDFDMSVY